MTNNFITKFWFAYKNYVRNVILPVKADNILDIAYWRNRTFCSILTYLAPFSIIALIPGIYMSFATNIPVIGFADIFSFLGILTILLHRGLTIKIRKIIFILIIYSLAVLLLYYLGKPGPGLIFLLSITILTSIFYSSRAAYYSAWVNSFICILFSFLLYFKIEIPIDNDYSVGTWIAVSSNLVLMSFVCAYSLNLLLEGLDKSMDQKNITEASLNLIIEKHKATEELLVKNEKRFRALVEHGADAVAIISPSGKVNYCSPNVEKLLGYTEKELLELDIFSMIHPDDLAETEKVLAHIMTTRGIPLPGRTGRMLHKDGSWRWLDATVTNMMHDPAINGIVDNFRDVTERVLAEQKQSDTSGALENVLKDLQKTLDSSLDIICTIDGEGKFVKVSLASVTILGYDQEELSGRKFMDFVYDEDLAKTAQAAGEIMNGKTVTFFENRYLHKNGTVIPIVWSAKWDDDDKLMYCIAKDVTEKIKAEEQKKFDNNNLNALINNTTDLMWSVDRNYNLLTSNRAFDEMGKTNFSKPIEKGCSVLSAAHTPEIKAHFISLYERAFAGETFTEIEHFQIPFEFWTEISYYPIRIGNEIIGTACNSRDITERKLVELEREQIISDLIQHSKDLEHFGYMVSHNLRLPVANIIGFSDLLREDDLEDEERKEYMSALFTSVKKLDDVVIDLSQILQVKKKVNVYKEEVSFSQLVTDIRESISSAFEKEEVKVETDFNEIDNVITIKSYMYSVFYNLISNSLKYKQKNVPLLLEIKSSLKDGIIQLTFKDNGMGINLTKYKDHVFGLYKRFHMSIDGKGMGLFMVKTQVESMGGSIKIESEVNKGTEFTIEFQESNLKTG